MIEKIVVVVMMLIFSLVANGYLLLVNQDLRESLDVSIGNTENMIDCAVSNAMLMNDTLWYYQELRESNDDLTMLNIAWSLYVATGNVSWLPQSPSEFENVTKG